MSFGYSWWRSRAEGADLGRRRAGRARRFAGAVRSALPFLITVAGSFAVVIFLAGLGIAVASPGAIPSRVLAALPVLTLAMVLAILTLAMRNTFVLGQLGRQLRREAEKILGSIDVEARSIRAQSEREGERAANARSRVDNSLRDIRSVVGEIRSDTEGLSTALLRQNRDSDSRPHVLFVTSNGAGLGHISRMSAIAGEVRSWSSVEILTLSTAHGIAGQGNIRMDYFASQGATGEPWHVWHRRFGRYLQRKIWDTQPAVVVFDGTWIYRGLREATLRSEIPLVWVCRGTWKEEADRTQVDRAKDYCDAVVVPGDLADHGGGPNLFAARHEVVRTSPVTALERALMHAPGAARAALGLDVDGRYVLVQLGAGNINDIAPARNRALEAIRKYHPGLIPIVVRPEIASSQEALPGVTTVRALYPLWPYLNAFEFAVTAAGYNTVHENIAAILPTIFVPNPATATDDQGFRARAIAGQGYGFAAASVMEIDHAIRGFSSAEVLDGLRRRMLEAPPMVGARDASMAIRGVVAAYRTRHEGAEFGLRGE